MSNIDLNITEADIAAMSLGSVKLDHIETSSKAFNAVGGEHTELTGTIVRQTDKVSFSNIMRDVVLTEIERFIFMHATADLIVVSLRIPPEAAFKGKNDCYGRWYVRLSVYPAAKTRVAA